MLETHALDGGGGRSDEDNAKLLNAAGKIGVLAQEAIPREDGVDLLFLADTNDVLAVLARLVWP